MEFEEDEKPWGKDYLQELIKKAEDTVAGCREMEVGQASAKLQSHLAELRKVSGGTVDKGNWDKGLGESAEWQHVAEVAKNTLLDKEQFDSSDLEKKIAIVEEVPFQCFEIGKSPHRLRRLLK